MIVLEKGIRIEGLPFWIDSNVRREKAFVSHPHADHAADHVTAIMSRESTDLYSLRYRSERILGLPWEKPAVFEKWRVTLFPSGHMLGSAQVLLEKDFRILYSGDFKLRKNAAAREIAIPETDILIMEATFGRPEFRFPPQEKVLEAMLEFIEGCFNEGTVPLFFAYSMGKAQELMVLLGRAGVELRVHEHIARAAAVYEKMGYRFGRYDVLREGERGEFAVIYPPSARKNPILSPLKARTALVSGWALRHSGPYDVGFPLSDHADYQDLISYVEAVDPAEVYVIRGTEFLKRDLETRGYTVHLLPPPKQLSMF